MKDNLILIFENLFFPINIKHHGYWKPPLTNAKELVNYATNHNKDNLKNRNWIEKYTSIDDEEIGTLRTIFLDFDISNKSYLKGVLTINLVNNVKKDLSDKIKIPIDFDNTNKELFIDNLPEEDLKKIVKYAKEVEKEKLSKLNNTEVQEYFYNKIKEGYITEPYYDAIKVANYFKEKGVATTINWSGSKGVHLRIPLNELQFNQETIKKDPKLFILSLAESIETIILDKPIQTSTLDYNVLNKNKGMERLPCSKHEVSHLYSNFFDPALEYEEAIKHLTLTEPEYIPEIVDKDKNTKTFLSLPIVKEAIETATTETELYPEENENPHYKFSANNKELKEFIDSIYIHGSRNELGYRVVHVLRRSGYNQEEVEEIFLELHGGNKKDFKETIGGSIKAAYAKDIKQLCGCKHLLMGVKKFIRGKNKVAGMKFIKENFNYHIVDEKTENETTPFRLKDKEITVKVIETQYDKWILFESIFDGVNLNINFNEHIGSFIKIEDDTEIISFEFKIKNKIFTVKKTDEKIIKEFLEMNDVEIPNHFFIHLNQYFRNAEPAVIEKKELNPKLEIYNLFTAYNTNLRYSRRKLGHFLREKGMILRERINNPYFLDKKSNGFNSVELDDIVKGLDQKIFNNEDVIHTDDVKEALGFIADRRRPVYNIVKFPNCLYDIENFKEIKATDEPIFTLTEVKYNYNPEAKGNKIIEFLKSSLKQEGETDSEINNRVNGFLEMIGYILTSGNRLNAFFIIAGIGGAGKGVATNLIISIFGSDKVGGLQLQELTPDNRFATAHLESKQVNIVRDSPKKPIKETGMLKSITGYDDVPVEPKGKDKYMIPKEEVPDMILVCNNIPKFEDGIEEAIVQRVVMFEFLNRFRGTDDDNKDLLKEILENDEEMEWLLYNSIKSYKKMAESGKDFKARIDEDKTRELLGKHTDPITYVLPTLVKSTVTEDISSEDPIIAKELNELIIYLCNKKGMSISELDGTGHIKAHCLADKIRTHFEFDDWTTESKYISDLKKSETVYPDIYKTAEYDTILQEMKKEKEKDAENNEI